MVVVESSTVSEVMMYRKVLLLQRAIIPIILFELAINFREWLGGERDERVDACS